MPRHLPWPERFWKKVQFGDGPAGCWLWLGHRNEHGYGTVTRQGRKWLAHRMAWVLETGVEPELRVLHDCDTPPCVRFEHLFLGTQQENIQDCINKGRRATDMALHGARITADQAEMIRQRYAQGGLSLSAVGDEFGIKKSQVHNIVKGHSWK